MAGRPAFLHWFAPSIVGIVLLLIALVAMAVLSDRSTTLFTFPNTSNTTETTIGYPIVMSIRSTAKDGQTSRSIECHWLNIAIVLLLTYVPTAVLGRWITGLSPEQISRNRVRQHPASVLGIVIASVTLVAAITAACVSLSMWGYFFSRPPLDSRVRNAKTLVTLTPFKTAADGKSLEVSEEEFPTTSRITEARANEGGYYEFYTRAAGALADRGMFNATPGRMPSERFATFHALMSATGKLDPGESGYTKYATTLRGQVFQLQGSGGESLLLICAASGEVSNDHHAYYEFLFKDESSPRLLAEQHFYYDVAGMEGFEFLPMLLVALFVGLLICLPITIIVMIIRRVLRRRREGRGFQVLPVAR